MSFGNVSSHVIAGERYWPDSDEVIPKYPGGSQDTILRSTGKESLLLGVLDASGGENAHLVSQWFANRFAKTISKTEDLAKQFQQADSDFLDSDNLTGKEEWKDAVEETAGTTASVVLIDSKTLAFANVGDSESLLIRDGKVFYQTSVRAPKDQCLGCAFRKQLASPPSCSPTLKVIEKQDGDIILIFSDGVRDVFDNEELVKRVGMNQTAKEVLLEAKERVSRRFASEPKKFVRDDMALVIFYCK